MENCLPQWRPGSASIRRVQRHVWTSRLLLFALFGFLSFSLSAQSPVQGRVTSGDSALSNVTVQLKGANIATQTDENGRFSINAPANGTLIFSAIGYSGQEVKIDNRSNIAVSLKNATTNMNEVIVVGYGTQRRGTITGAVSNIKSEDLVRTPATTVSAALVGKVQGITARAADARPGNGTAIQIRNLGNPLFVIDGVPYTGGSTNNTAFGFNQGSGQDIFNDIGLEDIESISILKDASASIYGLRAANGVVLVTTKKGKKNETPSINVSGYYGLQNFTRYPRPANAGQYIRGLLESEQNFGRDPASLYPADQLAKWEAGTEAGYKSYDYYSMVTRPNVPQYYISANTSGGTQRSTYYFSVSQLSQEALLKDFSYGRTNLQANLSTSLAKGLQIGTQIQAKLERTHNVGVPGLDDYFNPFLSITSMWPTESPYANDNPKYINQTHNVNVNPATYKNDVTGWVEEFWRGIDVKLNAQYDLPFGLSAKAIYSYNFQNEDFDGMEYTWNAYIYNPTTKTYDNRSPAGALYGNQNPWRERHKRNVISRYAQFQLNYSKSFGDHSISAVAGYEKSDYDNTYFVVHTIPTNNYVSLQFFQEQDVLTDQWSVEARAGYISRFNYNYKQKYLLELLGRYDGSYLYKSDRRWGFFPAVSVGWRLSEEPFFRDKVGNFVNEFKLRASYGETGSESGVNAFDYLPGYNFPTGSAILDGTYVLGMQPRGLPIVNLSWVTNQSTNVGIDFTLFNNKISGQFDVFQLKRTGLPASRNDILLPSEVGYTLPNDNLNSNANRGVEGIVTYNGKAGAVNYSIGVNGTLSRLRNLSTYRPRFGNSWDEYRNSNEDRWAGTTFGYHVIGRFQSMDDINTYPIDNDGQGNRTALPGDLKYQDYNGDKIINGMDQRPIGYAQGAQPYASFGTNLAASWKGFSLAIDFAGATMQSYRRTVELLFPFQNNGNSAEFMLTDRWHRENPYDPNSRWIPGSYPALRKGLTNHSNYNTLNDFWLTNVSYFRLKNLEIGYNIPKTILNRAGISRMRVYINGTNLFSFDNMKQFGVDPEISSGSGLVYPQQRLVNFGFSLSF
jgi:TonB-linked SusC/RagA family outer membrane protein